MKKSNSFLAVSLTISTMMVFACNTPSEKVENAENKVAEANKELNEANEAYLLDIQKYRLETAAKIASNDSTIAAMNAKIESEKKAANADYKKKIALLELKNIEMKNKMNDYKSNGKENWEMFKTEFNHDMEELGNAFKNLTVKNVK